MQKKVRIIEFVDHKGMKVLHVLEEATGEKPIISYDDLSKVMSQIFENGWQPTTLMRFNGRVWKWRPKKRQWDKLS